MYNSYRWCEMVAHEKITAAREAAVRDRLAAVAVQTQSGAGRRAQSRHAGLLRALVDSLGRGRPVMERKIPTGQVQ
jgi:hypothetical protein